MRASLVFSFERGNGKGNACSLECRTQSVGHGVLIVGDQLVNLVEIGNPIVALLTQLFTLCQNVGGVSAPKQCGSEDAVRLVSRHQIFLGDGGYGEKRQVHAVIP